MDSLDSQEVGLVFILRILNSPLPAAALPLAPVFQNRPSKRLLGSTALSVLTAGEGTEGSLEGSFGYLTKLYVILGSGVEM